MHYYLANDIGTQWFLRLYATHEPIQKYAEKNDGPPAAALIHRGLDVPAMDHNSQFFRNIYQRDQINCMFRADGNIWSCWSISEEEYNTIRTLTELYPAYWEYTRLVRHISPTP